MWCLGTEHVLYLRREQLFTPVPATKIVTMFRVGEPDALEAKSLGVW